MKSKYFLLLYVLVFGIFVSCITTTVFDKDLPKEKTATVLIGGEWTVTSYNGIEMEVKGGTDFIIPAGETEFIMDLATGARFHDYYFAKNVRLNYSFEAGKNYYIWFWFANDDGKIDRTSLGKGKLSLVITDKKDQWTALYSRELTFNAGPRVLK